MTSAGSMSISGVKVVNKPMKLTKSRNGDVKNDSSCNMVVYESATVWERHNQDKTTALEEPIFGRTTEQIFETMTFIIPHDKRQSRPGLNKRGNS